MNTGEQTPAPVKPTHAKPQLYALMFASLKGIARSFGYNLILDGSMSRDLDLIAIPWSKKPMDEFEMVQAFDRELTGRHKDSKEKYLFSIIANSRHKYVIDIDRGGYYRNAEGHIADPPQFRQDPQWYIDISVIPNQAALREENAKLKDALKDLLVDYRYHCDGVYTPGYFRAESALLSQDKNTNHRKRVETE